MNTINLNEIKLVNWNANGIKSKKSTVIEFLSRHKISIACITETHLKNSDKFKINGFNVYRTDRNSTHSSGGVAILIKNNIQHHQSTIPDMINLEAIAITVSTDGHDIKIIAAYNPPNKKIQSQDISELFKDKPTILLGDLNSKHQTWGCLKTNQNGNKLLKITSEQRIIISPPPSPTFQLPGRQPDILDIALNYNLPINVHHQVLNELDSDHVPVISTMNNQIKINHPIPKLINTPIKWEAFREILDKNLNNQKQYQNIDDINKSIEHITEAIKIAATRAQIKKKHSNITQSTDSLPIIIQNLIEEKHKVRKIWQRTRNLGVKRRLNQLTRRVKWELDNIRYSSYSAYLEKINPNDSSLWLATKTILRQRNVIPSLKNGLANYDTNAEKSEAFADYFESCFTTEDDTHHQNEHSEEITNKINYEHNTIITPTSPKEIQLIISKLASKKSPGHDLITNKILKNLTPKALTYLASLFNSTMRIGTFPLTWKHAIIVPIHKPGKQANSPTSYRPISLLPTLSKLYERILLNRIKPFLHIIPKYQFGFKTQHSTCHQIQRISEIIVHRFENKKYTTAVFLDLTQAFDKIWA